MTTAKNEPRARTEHLGIANVAARMLARLNASTNHERLHQQCIDVISPSRYRDASELRDGHRCDDLPDSEPCVIAGVESTMRRHVDLGAQLRKAIQRSGLTRNQIAKRADLSYAIVHGFVAGTNDLRLATASKIAAIVGVELRPPDGASRR